MTILSTNSARTIVHRHTKNESGHKFTPFTKLNSKWTINLYIKYSTIKLLDDLAGWDVGVGGRFKREGIYVYT